MEWLAVILADDLRDNNDDDPVLKQMVEVYEKYRCCVVAIEEVPKEETNKYGVIDGKIVDGNESVLRVSNMVEKPDPKDAPTNLAIIGRYILTPDIFEVIENTKPGKGGEIQITDALLELAKQGKVIATRNFFNTIITHCQLYFTVINCSILFLIFFIQNQFNHAISSL